MYEKIATLGPRFIGRSKCGDMLRVGTGTALTWESGSWVLLLEPTTYWLGKAG